MNQPKITLATAVTVDGLIRSLHAASSPIGQHDGYFRDAAHVIEVQQDHIDILHRHLKIQEEEIRKLRKLLEPFAKEAVEYIGWSGLITVDADEEGGTRETWYSIHDLRQARDALTLPTHPQTTR